MKKNKMYEYTEEEKKNLTKSFTISALLVVIAIIGIPIRLNTNLIIIIAFLGIAIFLLHITYINIKKSIKEKNSKLISSTILPLILILSFPLYAVYTCTEQFINDKPISVFDKVSVKKDTTTSSPTNELEEKYKKQEQGASELGKELEEKSAQNPSNSTDFDESHPDTKAWCSRIRNIIQDTDEQWQYWWPRATMNNGDMMLAYDASNTVALNLKEYIRYLDGGDYNIPTNATYNEKEKMKEIKKEVKYSMWRRVMAAEVYNKTIEKAMNGKDFKVSDANEVRNRINEADKSELRAVVLLRELDNSN